jgi:hypothetical protein
MPDPLLREFPDSTCVYGRPRHCGLLGRWFAGRGRPPQAAARRAGLEFVEKLLTTNLEFVEKLLTTNLASTDTTERKAGMLRRIRTVASVELAKTS